MITVKAAYEILKKEYLGKEILLNTIHEYKDCYAIYDMVTTEENLIYTPGNWWPGFPEIAVLKENGKILARFNKGPSNTENEKEWDMICNLIDNDNFIKSYNTDEL